MKKLLAFTFALFLPIAANATFISGNELLQKMNSPENIEKAFALGYVTGVFDSFDEIVHCNAPLSVTAGQVRDIVKKYLENNPATRNKSAELLIATAINQLWPCAQPKSLRKGDT